MELRQVRSFLAVAREGSITAAASALSLSQPALSRQIKALEEELGVELLERGAHSVSLTPSGEALAEDGRLLLEIVGKMISRVQVAGMGEVIRIGYAPSLVGSLLGQVLERFGQLHPRVRLQLHDCSTEEMKEGLAAGRLDLILTVPSRGDRGGIRWEPVAEREWGLGVSKNHQLASKETILPSDLDGERVVIYDRGQYPEYWEQVSDFFREQGINAKLAGEFDGRSSLLTAVEGGLGVALMALDSDSDNDYKRLMVKKLHSGPEPISVAAGMPEKEEGSPVLRVLLEELRRAGS